MIPDQKLMWDEKHTNNEHSDHRSQPMAFALLAEQYFTPAARILEPGCGVGSDSVYFSEKGYKVLASDFSQKVLEQNRALYSDKSVVFQFLDISQPTEFPDKSFDVVYAHLSLHYYDNETTKKIFKEIFRILKPGGLLSFACKSTSDSLYGKGKKIEQNLFVSPEGHVRHLFSKEYAKSLLDDMFTVQKLEEVEGEYANYTSKFIYCIAKKI